MNWIGGGLSRSRNAKNSVLAKQKQHFALKRATLQTHRSPPDIVFDLDPGYSNALEIPMPRSEHTKRHQALQQQTILDDFESTRPLAEKLQYLHEHHARKKRKRSPLEQIDPSTNHRAYTGKETSPISISSGSSSASSSISSRKDRALLPRPQFDTNVDGLSKRSIETKRRQLLQMRDWVGLERKRSQPVHMKFADPEDRDRIGRRRPVNVKSKHPSGYEQPLNRFPNVARHILPPDATRLQSDADEVSIRFGSAVDRSVKDHYSRGSIIQREPSARGSAYPDQYFSDLSTGKSYRIGDIVDRSVQDEDERVSLCNPLRKSPRSEEILVSRLVKMTSRSKNTNTTVDADALGSTSLSAHGRRDVLTPSAFMDSSSSSPGHDAHCPSDVGGSYRGEPQDFHRDHVDTQLTEDGCEWVLPDPNDQVASRYELRLIVPDTPRSSAQNVQTGRFSHIARDFTFSTPLKPIIPRSTATHTNDRNPGSATGPHVNSDPSLESLTITTPDWGMATSQLKTEFYKHVHGNQNPFKKKTSITNDFQPRAKEKPKLSVHQSTVHDDNNEVPQEAKARSQEPSISQEEDATWTAFLEKDTEEDAWSLEAPPAKSRVREGARAKDLCNAEATAPQKKQPEPTDDEEKIWQKFIFSDQDQHDEWTIEETLPEIISPYNPARTQPSMIAEVDTSPLKQNPHLDDDPSITSFGDSHDSSRLSKPRAIEVNHRRERQSEISSSDALSRAQFESDSPQGFPSIAGEASEDLTETYASISTSTHSRPRANQNISTSSLQGQASSIYVPSLPMPHQLSSDELAPGWSPTRSQLNSGRLGEPKVVFTPPKRYIGEKADELPRTLHIGGRVLRNGKETGQAEQKYVVKAKGGRKRGRPRKEIRHEIDGDEILDD